MSPFQLISNKRWIIPLIGAMPEPAAMNILVFGESSRRRKNPIGPSTWIVSPGFHVYIQFEVYPPSTRFTQNVILDWSVGEDAIEYGLLINLPSFGTLT